MILREAGSHLYFKPFQATQNERKTIVLEVLIRIHRKVIMTLDLQWLYSMSEKYKQQNKKVMFNIC